MFNLLVPKWKKKIFAEVIRKLAKGNEAKAEFLLMTVPLPFSENTSAGVNPLRHAIQPQKKNMRRIPGRTD